MWGGSILTSYFNGISSAKNGSAIRTNAVDHSWRTEMLKAEGRLERICAIAKNVPFLEHENAESERNAGTNLRYCEKRSTLAHKSAESEQNTGTNL